MIRRSRTGGPTWRRWLPFAVVTVAATLVVSAAVVARGYPVRELDLHDSGIWVTNDLDAVYGRANKTAAAIDAWLNPPGEAQAAYRLDVFQDGASTVVRDIRGGRLIPVDPVAVANEVDAALAVAPDDRVAMAGGTLAVLEAKTGALRAVRYAPGAVPGLAGLETTAEPIATVGEPPTGVDATVAADVAVGLDGTIHAVSASGQAVTITPNGLSFAEPEASQVDGLLESVRVTAVGAQKIVADAVTGKLYLPQGKTRQFPPDGSLVVQQPGAEAPAVLVATTSSLVDVPLDGADPSVWTDNMSGTPAAPVVLAGCAFGAWAGQPGRVVRGCTGGAALEQTMDRANGVLTSPVFRVNRDSLILNDTANGRVYDTDLKQSIDNWEDIKPKQDDSAEEEIEQAQRTADVPQANPDHLGARPGRTSVLHVLDNDTDPAASILAVSAVTQPATGTVTIAPDGQTVQLDVPADATGAVTFDYTISNGQGTSTAQVTVTLRSEVDNEPPTLALNAHPAPYTVASFGSVAVPVAGDWRDLDADPVTVVSATADDRALPVTGEGLIHFTAPQVAVLTSQEITYELSDGMGLTVPGTVTVNVLPANATTGHPPITQPDVAQGRVGHPVTFAPLANDIPGADPLNPRASLKLAGQVPQPVGLAVSTDVLSGRVTVTAQSAGIYYLDYTAAFGSAAFSQGRVRINIFEDLSEDPVAVPDQMAVRGQAPVTVDPLANDVDPTGGIVTVSAVTPVDPEQLQVAVVKGRWVRIMPLVSHLSPNPQVVHYTMTNGLATVSGDIRVTQLDAVDQDHAIVNDDFATVRAGDTTLIAVLDNDASESGLPLVLDDNMTGLPAGHLKVLDAAGRADVEVTDLGRAYVAGGKIRYIAPATVEAPRQVKIEYIAATALGVQDTGTVTITVNPAPSESNPNTAPEPPPVEVRGVSGDTIKISIPLAGADQDGDSVTLRGLGATAPKLGRVINFSPTVITYEAFPAVDNNGTDTFEYVVTDRYGATGRSIVRVGLAPPGQTQAPVAVDDAITAQPGAAVTVDPLSNDLVAIGDRATIEPLERVNSEIPAGVALGGDFGPISAKAPGAEGAAVLIGYQLVGSGGVGPSATVSIRSREGYLNPPHVFDHVAEVDALTGTADLLAGAWDIDGPLDELTVSLDWPGAVVDGNTVTLPVADYVQVVPYVVTDGDGAASAAVVYVAPGGAGPPHLIVDGRIDLAPNSSATVPLADYIESPRGTPIRITVADFLQAAPGSGLMLQAASLTSITVTSMNDYIGPGAVTLEVMDGVDATDPDAITAVVSIPVQVGPSTPVLRCPELEQTLIQGGDPLTLDITSLCHVWTADPTEVDRLAFTAEWETPLAGVQASTGEHSIRLQAAGSAVPDSTSRLIVGVQDSAALTQALPVRVLAAPKPKMVLAALTDVKQGTTVDQSLVMQSPLLDAVPTIMRVTQVLGPACVVTISGTTIHLTPGADVHGTMTFDVLASDLADPNRVERQITGTFTMVVYGRPDPPQAPQPGQQIQTHAVSLTWTAGNDNGAVIEEFEVTGAGQVVNCGRATRCDITGVANGQPVTFTVRARNRAGWSDPSPVSAPVIPNEPPGAVTNLSPVNPQDGALTLTWGPAPVDGTPVTAYHITWGGGSLDVGGTATSVTITGLNNTNVYTFTVVAENAAGLSKVSSTTDGQSSGRPLGLSAPVVQSQDLGDTAQVTVSWTAAQPNGPAPVTYTVTRTGGTGPKTFAAVTGTQIGDPVVYDGTDYTYSVTATNATGGPDHTSPAQSVSWKATGVPANWGAWTAQPTGVNQEVTLTYTVPASRGAQSKVTLVGGPGGQLPTPGPAGGPETLTLATFTNGQATEIRLRVCNELDQCKDSAPLTVTAFGPLSAPTLTAWLHGSYGDHQVCATATGSGNGAPASLVIRATGAVSGPQESPPQVGSGDLAVTGWCIDAGSASRQVSFTAVLTTQPTNPARVNPDSPTASVTTLRDPPNPLQTPDLQVWQQGSVGNWTVCGRATGHGLGDPATLTLTSTIAGGSMPPQSGSGALDSGQLCVYAGAPGVTVTFTATLPCGAVVPPRPDAVPAQKSVTSPRDPPLANPALDVWNSGQQGNYQVCGRATGHGAGHEAVVRIWADGYGEKYSAAGSGNLATGDLCFSAGGPNTTVTFKAQVLTGSSWPGRDNSQQVNKNVKSTAAPPPPSVSVQLGAYVKPCSSGVPGGCYEIKVTTQDFPGSVTCRITETAVTGTTGWAAWTQGANETRTVAGHLLGNINNWAIAVCDSVSSGRTPL